jgi:hypothetical protein
VGNVEAVLSAPDQRPDAPREPGGLTNFGPSPRTPIFSRLLFGDGRGHAQVGNGEDDVCHQVHDNGPLPPASILIILIGLRSRYLDFYDSIKHPGKGTHTVLPAAFLKSRNSVSQYIVAGIPHSTDQSVPT